MKSEQSKPFIKRLSQLFRSLTFSLLKLLFWLSLFTIIIMPVIYLYGSQKIHQIDTHPLYDIFQTEPYVKLIQNLDRHPHIILHGVDNKTQGIEHFLIHYANKKIEAGSQVVLTDLTSNDDMELENILTRIRYFYQDNLNMVEEEPTIWILVTEDNQIPEIEFDAIESRYPKDKFIIVTNDKVNFRPQFKKFTFPKIDKAEFKDQIMHSFDVDLKTAQILLKYYQTIPNLITSIQTTEFSPQTLLGQDYHHTSNLTTTDKKILYQLCTTGKCRDKKQSVTLQEFGTIYFQGQYYWVNNPSRLNYQLHSGLQCKPILMSRKMKQKMIQKEEEARIKADVEAKIIREEEERKRHEAQEKAEKIRKKTLEA